MTEYRVYWRFHEHEMSEQEEEKLATEILESYNDVKRGNPPIEKSFEEGIVLSGLTLLVHNPETLVSIYNILKDQAALAQIRIFNADTNLPVFQVLTKNSQNIGSAEDIEINQYDADAVQLIDAADREELYEVQKLLDGQEAIMERLDDLEEQIEANEGEN
jgi:hypothetical protein